MKKLLTLLVLVLSLSFAGCVHVPTIVDRTYLTNKATYGVLSKYYKQRCRQDAVKCRDAGDLKCQVALDCLASFKKAMQISGLIDAKLYTVKTTYDAVDGGVEAAKLIREAIKLVIELEKIVADLQLKKLLE